MLIGPLRERGVDAVLTPTFDDAEAYLRAHWQAGDVVITHGLRGTSTCSTSRSPCMEIQCREH